MMRGKQIGFSMIEVLVFIVVTSLIMSTLLLSATTALRSAPGTHQQWLAMQTAQRCMEWFLDQRRINGYDSLTCPSTPAPAACTAPSGLSVSAAISCTTWNTDANYKTITVTVAGLANATLSTQIGSYQ